MKKLEATFQIVTPMFLGGADQAAEMVRPASVKGALRFWWRALNWARCLGEKADQETEGLRHLHAEEARLFGIAAGDKEKGGQGIFLMQVHEHKIDIVAQPFKPLESGQLYLLGQGLGTFKNGNSCLRNAIQTNGQFGVRLAFRPSASESDFKQISDALLMFGLLGALGSRARHGLGSVVLTEWNGAQKTPQTQEEYTALLTSLLVKTQAKTEPPLTAFSHLSRIDLSQTNVDALTLLNLVGMEQQMYRSFGSNGKVNGKVAERNFKNDHDLILSATENTQITHAPERTVFGLPHNYFFSSTKAKADVNYAPNGDEGRRSSPLLLHIHKIDSVFVAVHTLLPAKFLPDLALIRIKAKKSIQVKPTPDWEILHRYLNRFSKGVTIHGNK